MLCGGDIPDVMWDGDPLGVRANLRNGFIMELPFEVILEHAPTYVAYLNRFGREAWLYSHYQGKNYGPPHLLRRCQPASYQLLARGLAAERWHRKSSRNCR